MKLRLLVLLKIHPDEARMALQVALFFGLIELARAISGSAADTLFFRRFGVEYLPYMYIALGILTFGASLGYAAFVGRLEKRRFFPGLLLGMALLMLLERAAILLDNRALYPLLWLSINIVASLLGILVWTAAGETCDTRQAKRLFPIFVSSSILGDLLGGLVIGPAARLLGTENLILLYALVLAGAALLVRAIARANFKVVQSPDQKSTFLTDISAGFDYVKRAPLLQLLGVSAVLFSILFFSISFPFGKAVSAAFPSEAGLAGFLGLFQGVSSALMFVAALLIANRLYARIGIVFALLLLPVTYLLGFILFAVNFSLSSAVIVRLAQLVVLSGIGDGAYSSFFNVVPPQRRAQVRAFDAGVPSQIGIILSGILLILGERLLTNSSIFGMGMLVAVLCGFVVWRMRGRYGEALAEALRAGRIEVFNQGERIFAGLAGDLQATRLLTAGLADPRPVNQQLAAEMLARIQATAAAPALIARLPQASGEVRVAFIRSLGRLGAPAAARPVAAYLRDDTPAVRQAALEALPALSAPGDPEILNLVRPLLADPDLDVRLQAAVGLARCGDAASACRALLDSLRAAPGDEQPRSAILRALGAVFAAAQLAADPATGAALEAVVACLRDESAALRRAACQALAPVTASPALHALARCLLDPVPGVRAAAARSLRAAGPAAAPFVLEGLASAPDPAVVLDALPPRDPAIAAPLRDYARVELDRLQRWRAASRALPRTGRAADFLASLIAERAAQAEQHLVKIIGLLGNPAMMQLVASTLKTGDPEARATAIEALDTLGDKQLVKAFLPLLEDAVTANRPNSDPSAAADGVLRGLIAGEDAWLRALALRAAGELELNHIIPDTSPAPSGADVRASAAGDEPRQPAGGMVETLQTLSLVERTLLLHEVPLFSELAADDLVQVAQIAAERWFDDGAVLCREGEKGDSLFIIAMGHVSVTRQFDGHEKELAIRHVGDIVGEMAIIDAIPRFATLSADGEVRTLVITAEAFKAILRDRPEVSLAVMRTLSHRLQEGN